jgi:hypothetical protein
MLSKFKVIGLCGVARSGKDSFCKFSKEILQEEGITPMRFAFADALKWECDKFLWSHTRISAFTDDNEEKDIIRPLLVAWGTNIRRKLDEDCWIKKIEPEVKSCINNPQSLPVITDVRYPNEADWVHKLGGAVIHISREGNGPANKEEEENDPILKSKSDHWVNWGTLGDETPLYKKYIQSTLTKLSQ